LLSKVLVSIQVDERLFSLAKFDLSVAVLKTQNSGKGSCSFCGMGLVLTLFCGLSIFINDHCFTIIVWNSLFILIATLYFIIVLTNTKSLYTIGALGSFAQLFLDDVLM